MINLHGCAQTGDDLRERGNWESTAEAFGMIVALPTVPDGGKIAGCWDYYGKPSFSAPSTPRHTRQNRDNDNILALVDRLLEDEMLGVDPEPGLPERSVIGGSTSVGCQDSNPRGRGRCALCLICGRRGVLEARRIERGNGRPRVSSFHRRQGILTGS